MEATSSSNFLTVPGQTGAIWQRKESDGSVSDFAKLKAMTERLNLSTQRPSYVEWKAQYMEKPDIVKSLSRGSLIPKSEQTDRERRSHLPYTLQRKNDLDQAIAWLKNELVSSRHDRRAIKI